MAQHDVIIVYKMKDEVSPGIDKIDNKTDELGNKAKKTGKNFDNLGKTNFSSLTGRLMRLTALFGAGLGLREVINTTAEFQKQQAVLNTMFGEQMGAQYFENLKKQSEQLPASMGEVTSSFVKLQGVGITATNDELRSLSDLASAAGKNVLDASEAVVGAITGEYERLKGLNIVASVDGNKLTLMYRNQKTTIDNNTASIRKYIMGLGQMKGVAGSSNKIMNTMGGVMSNIGDSFSNIAFELGKALLPLMKKLGQVVGWISSKMPAIINFFKEWGFIIKPVLAGITSLFVITKLIGIITKLIVIIKSFRVAFAALNRTMLLNPFVAIASAVIALGVALFDLQKKFGGWGNLWTETIDTIKQSFETGFLAIDLIFQSWWFNVKYTLGLVKIEFGKVFFEIQKASEALMLSTSGNFMEAAEVLKKTYDSEKEYVKFQREMGKHYAQLYISGVTFKNSNLQMQRNKLKWLNKAGWVGDTTGGVNQTGWVGDTTGGVNQTGTNTGTPGTTITPITQGLTDLTAQSNVKYINISVNKMIENFTISTTNLTEASGKIKEEIITILHSAIADASSIQN